MSFTALALEVSWTTIDPISLLIKNSTPALTAVQLQVSSTREGGDGWSLGMSFATWTISIATTAHTWAPEGKWKKVKPRTAWWRYDLSRKREKGWAGHHELLWRGLWQTEEEAFEFWIASCIQTGTKRISKYCKWQSHILHSEWLIYQRSKLWQSNSCCKKVQWGKIDTNRDRQSCQVGLDVFSFRAGMNT